MQQEQELARIFEAVESFSFSAEVRIASSWCSAVRICKLNEQVQRLTALATDPAAQSAVLTRVLLLCGRPFEKGYSSPFDEAVLALLVVLQSVRSVLLTDAVSGILSNEGLFFSRRFLEAILQDELEIAG